MVDVRVPGRRPRVSHGTPSVAVMMNLLRVESVVMRFENVVVAFERVVMADAFVGAHQAPVAVHDGVVVASNANVAARLRLVTVSCAERSGNQEQLVATRDRAGVHDASAAVRRPGAAARPPLATVPDEITAVDYPFAVARRASVAARYRTVAVAHAKTDSRSGSRGDRLLRLTGVD